MSQLAANMAFAVGRELVSYRWARLDQFDDPRWAWTVVGAGLAACVLLVVVQYRRESASLSAWAAILLGSLRIAALVGMAIFFLGPTKQMDAEVVSDSRVAILADVSQSMSIADAATNDGGRTQRIDEVAAVLTESPLLEQLRREHDVAFAVFDERFERVFQWKRVAGAEPAAEGDPQAQPAGDVASQSSTWSERLTAGGVETRMGDALAAALAEGGGGPLAAVVLFSDGGQNSGANPSDLTEVFRARRVPIFTIGVGSTEPRRNIRIRELTAPSRAFPNDKTPIRAVVQAEGARNQTVEVQLFTRLLQGDVAGPTQLVDSVPVQFDASTDMATAEFIIEPQEVGRLELEVRAAAPVDDERANDNQRTAEVDVVESSSRILLIAGGATRDYRFLRNQLRRDPHATVDVWLQFAPPGISQDASEILDNFPTTKEDLYQYDGIVAFDPDWTLIDSEQAELLEAWVAEEAGGLVVVAGPVHMSTWVQSPDHAKIRALYPVEFQRRLTLLDDGLYGSQTPWPISFSREGMEAQFLSLTDSLAASREIWERFAGVFGCYAVKGPKPGAQVYGRYSDPDAGISVDRPVYMAEQFYGAGRVFYLGSGEVWRLRGLDPAYFEVLYTQLIRHVTQGRLLRGSSRGLLLIEKDNYKVGDDVVIRAQLSTARQEPYLAEQVAVAATAPDGTLENVSLAADTERPGNFVGQLAVLQEGAYRLELPVPDAIDQQLSRRIQVSVPDLEFEGAQRNVELLAGLARQTDGRYYEKPVQAVEGGDYVRPLPELVPSQAETKIVEGEPDETFTRRVRRWLLGVICGCLCTEWLLRRLLRLA